MMEFGIAGCVRDLCTLRKRCELIETMEARIAALDETRIPYRLHAFQSGSFCSRMFPFDRRQVYRARGQPHANPQSRPL